MRFKSVFACASLLTGAVVVLSQPAAHAAPTRYEAENSPAVCTGTIDSNWAGFSGSGFCNGNNATGAYAQFTVNASAAGTATLGVRFANGTTTARPASLIVNGSTVQTPSFEGTGAWSTWVTKTLTVSVNAGSNTIRLNPTTANGLPNVDYLEFEAGGGSNLPYGNVPDGFARGTTGGAGGQTVTVTTQAQLAQYAGAVEPYIIRVSGSITISPKGTELRVASNKTIVGAGTTAEIVGGGFRLISVSNVIIRNLTIRDTRMPDDDPGDDLYDYDAIQIDSSSNIWIDHNRLARMNDGLLDSRKDTTNLTVSWNQFLENNKTFGIGWTENVTARVTVHHNWFRGNNTRNPVADNVANWHLYNNYLQDIRDYGNRAHGATKAVIENSYYQNVPDPYYVEGTAELVENGSILVNSPWRSGRIRERGSAFNPSTFYSYTLHPAADVPNLVRTYSGPQAGIGA